MKLNNDRLEISREYLSKNLEQNALKFDIFDLSMRMLLYVCGIVIMFMILYANVFIEKSDKQDTRTVENEVDIYNNKGE